jgi:hypothetical protein
MAIAVLIITLLTLAASLASWLFSQWLAKGPASRRLRSRWAAQGRAADLRSRLVIVGAASGWQHWVPGQEFSSPFDSASASASGAALSSDAWPAKQQPLAAAEPAGREDPARIAERQRMSARKAEMLASAAGHLEQSEYKQAVDLAREYLALNPHDDDMLSMLAPLDVRRPASRTGRHHPGCCRRRMASDRLCYCGTLRRFRALDARQRFAVAWWLCCFASCEQSETSVLPNALVSQGWSYEPAGILMTAANDRPVPLRLGNDGPLVAPIFTIRDAGHARRQITLSRL